MPGPNLAAMSLCEIFQEEFESYITTVNPSCSPQLCDVLLELRSAARVATDQPGQLVSVFLRNRRMLARYDYLWTHRLRRQLEQSFQLNLRAEGEERVLPLVLAWSSLEKLLNRARHEYFEHSRSLTDWQKITLTLEPRS